MNTWIHNAENNSCIMILFPRQQVHTAHRRTRMKPALRSIQWITSILFFLVAFTNVCHFTLHIPVPVLLFKLLVNARYVFPLCFPLALQYVLRMSNFQSLFPSLCLRNFKCLFLILSISDFKHIHTLAQIRTQT